MAWTRSALDALRYKGHDHEHGTDSPGGSRGGTEVSILWPVHVTD